MPLINRLISWILRVILNPRVISNPYNITTSWYIIGGRLGMGVTQCIVRWYDLGPRTHSHPDPQPHPHPTPPHRHVGLAEPHGPIPRCASWRESSHTITTAVGFANRPSQHEKVARAPSYLSNCESGCREESPGQSERRLLPK